MSHHNDICKHCFNDKYSTDCDCDKLRQDFRPHIKRLRTITNRRTDEIERLIRKNDSRSGQGNTSENEET